MVKLRFTYKNKEYADVTLAEGLLGTQIIEVDGNYYVSKDSMQNLDKLKRDEEAYTCPYKGKCDYLDLYSEDNRLIKRMATWTYPNPNPGWEMIDDKYGFPKTSGLNDIEIQEIAD